MTLKLPERIIFACDDAAILSPMCAAAYLAFSRGQSTSLSVACKNIDYIHPIAAKVCEENGVKIANHRRLMWSDKLISEFSPDVIVALTPGAQHVILEVTGWHHIDVEYWPLHRPNIEAGKSKAFHEAEFTTLLELIRSRLVSRFSIGKNWEDVSPLPSLAEEQPGTSEDVTSTSLTREERVSLVKYSLENRSVEINSYLLSLRILIEEKIHTLEGRKPNNISALEEWQTWMHFLLDLRQAVLKLLMCVDSATSNSLGSIDLAEKTQNALDVYKVSFLKWPRENAKEVVDGTFRASLVGCCAIVGGLFGQPIAGALIGSAIFGGPKVGKAIGDAIGHKASAS